MAIEVVIVEGVADVDGSAEFARLVYLLLLIGDYFTSPYLLSWAAST